MLLAHGIEPTRTRARGRVNREKLAEVDLHWHDLRHEAARRWLSRGLELRAIQLLLGHADLETTQRSRYDSERDGRGATEDHAAEALEPQVLAVRLLRMSDLRLSARI